MGPSLTLILGGVETGMLRGGPLRRRGGQWCQTLHDGPGEGGENRDHTRSVGSLCSFWGLEGAEPVWSARMHVSKLASSPYHMGTPYSL